MAVPTFFVISSFLFFRKARYAEKQWNLVCHYVKRLALLYLFWCLVWSPIIYIQKDYFHPISATVPLLLVRDFFLGSMFDASWFLGALLVGVPIVWGLSRLFRKDVLVMLIPLLASLYLQYVKLLPEQWRIFYDWYDSFELPQLSFLNGMLWIAVGYVVWTPCVRNGKQSEKCLGLASFGSLLCLEELFSNSAHIAWLISSGCFVCFGIYLAVARASTALSQIQNI